MKKALAVFLCLCSVFLLSMISGCGSESTFNPENKNIYTVRVEGGSGSGDYFEGSKCEIVAEVPEGKQFMYWQSGGEKISARATYMFEVTEDVVMRAVFEDDVENIDKESRTVSVTQLSFLNGLVNDADIATGTGTYLEDSTCTVKLNNFYAAKESFKGWAVMDAEGKPGAIVSESVSYTFTVKGDMQLVPVFDQGFVKLNRPGKETARFKNPYLEFNREQQGTDKFVDYNAPELDYLRVNLYSNPNGSGEPAGWFRLLPDPTRPNEMYVAYADGTRAFDCVGNYNNTFRNTTTPTDHAEFFKQVLGDNYVAGNAYYFTSQAVAKAGTLEINGIQCELADSMESEVNDAYYYTAT